MSENTIKPKKPTATDKRLEAALDIMRMHPQLTMMIAHHRKGLLISELAGEFAKVNHQVRRCGKKGQVVLKWDIVPVKGDSSQVYLVDDITTKIPKPDSKPETMFIGDQNMLVATDPSQMELQDLDEEEEREVRDL